jgi:hypothetical protein
MNQDHTSSSRPQQGAIPSLADEADLRRALDQAFDYRGDVTVTLKDGRTIEGYIFDRRTGSTLESSAVRIIPRDADHRLTIAYSQITSLVFSGRDTAHGKSWETWVRKYVDKKLKGEKAEIASEELD